MALPIAASAAAILAQRTLKEETVDVPEWGCAVKIREFTVGQRQALTDRAKLRHATRDRKAGEVDPNRLELLMLIAGVVEPSFSEADLPALRELGAGPINRVTKAILALSGITEEASDAAEADFSEES